MLHIVIFFLYSYFNFFLISPVAHTDTIVPSSCSWTVCLTAGSVVVPISPGMPGGFSIFETSVEREYLVRLYWTETDLMLLRLKF